MRKILFLLFLAMGCIARAQQDEVIVSLTGVLDSTIATSSVTMVSPNTVNSGGTSGVSAVNGTMSIQARMVPGATYQITGLVTNHGTATYNAKWMNLSVAAPPGYYAQVGNITQAGITIPFSPSATSPIPYSIPVRVVPVTEDLGLRAGMATSLTTDKVLWKLSLGSLLNGTFAGHLSLNNLASLTSLASMFSSTNLNCDATSSAVTVLYTDSTKTQIRQVIAPQVDVDIYWTGSTMTIKCFPPLAGTLGSNGYYSFGCDPYAIYNFTVSTNDAVGASVQVDFRDVPTIYSNGNLPARSLTSTLTRTGTAPNSVWTAAAWHTTSGSNLITQTRAFNATGDTITLTDGAGLKAFTKSRTYFSTSDPVLSALIGNESLGSARWINTNYNYYTTGVGSYGLLSRITSQDSGAASSFTYNSYGMLMADTEPYKNTVGQVVTTYSYSFDPFGNPTRVSGTRTTTNGTVTSSNAYIYSAATVPFASHPHLSVYSDEIMIGTSNSGTLITYLNNFAEDSGSYPGWQSDDFFLNQPKSIYRPDGTAQAYLYQRGAWNGSTFTPSTNGGIDVGPCSLIGVITGGGNYNYTSSFASGCSVLPNGFVVDSVPVVNGKSTFNLAIRDSCARVVYAASYIYSSWNWVLLSSTTYSYNLANELTGTSTSTGSTSSVYSGEQLVNTTDQAGIVTSFVYDAADRVQSATRAGLQTNYTYDAANHVLSETVVGAGENLVTTHTYGDDGELSQESAPGLGVINYAYNPSALTETRTLPDNNTQIQQLYLDGRPQSITGTGVVPQYYDYGVDSDSTTYAVVSVGSSTSPRWQRTWSDWAGREFKTSQPDPSVLGQAASWSSSPIAIYNTKIFDSSGRVDHVTQTGLGSTYYQYDEFSQVIRSGLDVDSSGSLSTSTTDRIVDTSNDFESIGGAWWQVTRSTIYPTLNSGNSITASVVQKRLSGFSGGLVEEEKTTDIDGNVTDRTVTVSGNTTTISVTAPNLAKSSVQTIVNGLPTSTTEFDGLQTTYGYDSLYRLHTVTDKRGNTTTTYYGPNTALVSSIKDAAGYTSTFGYDNLGRQTSATNPLGQTACTDYTPFGQVWHQWGVGTYPVAFTYDNYGQKKTLTTYRSASPSTWAVATWPTPPTAGDTTTWNYDNASGVLTSKVDAAGATQSFFYNQLGQTLKTTSARNISTHYTYDPATAELLSVAYDNYTDARGTVSTPSTAYTYTRLGQPSTITDTAGLRTFNYPGGTPLRLSSLVLPAYFNNRTYTPIYENSTSASTGTLNGRPVGFSLATASTEFTKRGTISNLGRLTGLTTQTNGGAVASYAYSYNADGTAAGYSVGSFSVGQTFEPSRNLITQVKAIWAGTAVTQFDYVNTAVGQRQSVQQSGTAFANYGGNVYRFNLYNNRGEMQTSAMYNGSAPALTGSPTSSAEIPGRRYEFRYDDIGNRTTGGETGSAAVDEVYSSNNLNQYQNKENTTVRITGTVAAGSKVSAYSSDQQIVAIGVNGNAFGGDLVPKSVTGPATGNATVYAATTIGGTAHIYSSTKNWSFSGLSQPFTYDLDGNLINDAINNYFYDAENRLVKVVTTSTAVGLGFANQTLQFTYDYMGRRIEKKVTNAIGTTTATRFVYDGWKLVEEIDGSSLGLLKTYTWNGALAQIQDLTVGKILLPTFDANGNVAALINASSGNVEAVYEYGTFGELIRAEGVYANSNHFRFSSEYQDDETGFIYYGHRYYAPAWGRFINRDPIGEFGGINVYGFCGNDGINHSDYLGLSWLSKFFHAAGNAISSSFKPITSWRGLLSSPWERDPGFYLFPDAYQKILPTVAGAVVGIVVGIYSENPELGAAAGGFVSGLFSGLLNGASVADSLVSGVEAAAISVVTAYALGGGRAPIQNSSAIDLDPGIGTDDGVFASNGDGMFTDGTVPEGNSPSGTEGAAALGHLPTNLPEGDSIDTPVFLDPVNTTMTRIPTSGGFVPPWLLGIDAHDAIGERLVQTYLNLFREKTKLPGGGRVLGRVDLGDRVNKMFYEIKPDTPGSFAIGRAQVQYYAQTSRLFDVPYQVGDASWMFPDGSITVKGFYATYTAWDGGGGVILYTAAMNSGYYSASQAVTSLVNVAAGAVQSFSDTVSDPAITALEY